MDIGHILATQPTIIENIFIYLNRRELDSCSKVCELWGRVAETVKNRREVLCLTTHLEESDKVNIARQAGVKEITIIIAGVNYRLFPWKLKGDLDAALGAESISEIKFTRQGNVAVKIKNLRKASKFLKTAKLGGADVKVRVVEDTICCKYVIRIHPDVSLEDIAEELDNQDIKWCQITRFTKAKSDEKTQVVLIKEIGGREREYITLYLQRFRVSPYKEFPKVCKRCQGFNHFQFQCKREPRCAVCGEQHNTSCCLKEKPECFRCGGEHSAQYKKCPKIIEVGKAQELARKEGIKVTKKTEEARDEVRDIHQIIDEANNNFRASLQESLLRFNEELKDFIAKIREETAKAEKVNEDLEVELTKLQKEQVTSSKEPQQGPPEG